MSGERSHRSVPLPPCLLQLAFAITAFAVIAEYLDKQLDDTTQARLAYTVRQAAAEMQLLAAGCVIG